MKIRASLIPVIMAAASAACGQSGVDIETVPVGAEVAVTRDDGGVVQGTLAERTPETVKLNQWRSSRSVDREAIADVQLVSDERPVDLPETARFREVTVPAETAVDIRLSTALDTKTTHTADPVEGVVANAVMVDGEEVIPAGSLLRGAVLDVEESGKVKGRARLSVRFNTLTIADHEAPYAVTLEFAREAEATKGEDAKKIGIPAAGGAIIGGIIGGKKGAVVGGVIGGGAGTAVVLTTEGKNIEVPKGTVLRLTLEHPVDVRIPIGSKAQRP